MSEDEAALLTAGMTAQLTVPGTGAVAATISSVATSPPTTDAADATRREVILAPAQLTTEQSTALRGANIKVIIDVASTQGEVLAVPLAALFSDADGNTQVEVLAGGRQHPVPAGDHRLDGRRSGRGASGRRGRQRRSPSRRTPWIRRRWWWWADDARWSN